MQRSRDCEERSDETIHTSFVARWIASWSLSSGVAAPVIGRAFARPGGADRLAPNAGYVHLQTDALVCAAPETPFRCPRSILPPARATCARLPNNPMPGHSSRQRRLSRG